MINGSGAARICLNFAEECVGIYRYLPQETRFPKDRSQEIGPRSVYTDAYAMGMVVYEVGLRPSWIVWSGISVKSYLVLGLDWEHPVLRVR